MEIIRDAPKENKRRLRIEDAVRTAEDYGALVKRFEIKILDKKTGLREIKLDRLRALHVRIEGDTVVLLGMFIKKTQKTPQAIIDKNNARIERYKEQKHD